MVDADALPANGRPSPAAPSVVTAAPVNFCFAARFIGMVAFLRLFLFNLKRQACDWFLFTFCELNRGSG